MRVSVLFRPIPVLAALWLACTLLLASAHATLVLGRFAVEPAQPAADAPLTLEDPTQVPIEAPTCSPRPPPPGSTR